MQFYTETYSHYCEDTNRLGNVYVHLHSWALLQIIKMKLFSAKHQPLPKKARHRHTIDRVHGMTGSLDIH